MTLFSHTTGRSRDLVMGLGPHGAQLLPRLGKSFQMTEDWVSMEQNERTQLRRAAMLAHAAKNRTPPKPMAPVQPLPKQKGVERLWTWTGERIESKGLWPDGTYTASQIRAAGFKLPTLGGKKHDKETIDSGSIAPIIEIVDETHLCTEQLWHENEC